MPKDLSPEEKLLQLIRSKGKSKPKSADSEEIKERKDIAQGKEIVSGPKKPAQGQSKISIRSKRTISTSLGWESLNCLLFIIAIALFSYFMYDLFLPPPPSEIKEAVVPKNVPAVEVVKPQAKPLSYYSGQIGSRNIFQPVVKEDSTATQQKEATAKVEEIKDQLNLLGIMAGDNPQVIIEDKKVNKTYFLNKGDSFQDIDVEDILNGKVILSYKDKQFELVL